jgi:hypothetical protein
MRGRRENCGLLLTSCEALACNGIHVQLLRLSLEHPQLNRPRNTVSRERKRKTQLKPNVASKRRLARMQRNRPHKPNLRHASHHPHNAAAEGEDRRDAGREALGLVVILRAITLDPTAEDKVLGQRNPFVDCQPVADEVHEVLQDGFEVAVAGDGDCNVHACADGGPDESGDALRPVCQDLDGATE